SCRKKIVALGAALLSFALLSGETRAGEAEGPIQAPPADRPVGPTPGMVPQPAEPANPYEGNAIAAQQGRTLFVAYNCYGCHGGRAGGGMGPSLRDADWLYGGSPAAIYNSIAQGCPHSMPAWGLSLPPEIIWKMTTYILTLDSPDEPDAPRRELSANP